MHGGVGKEFVLTECFLFFIFLRVRFFPNFIDPAEADDIYNDLYHEVPWRQRSDVKNGESFLQPRLTAWYGDFPYSYSGVHHEANTEVILVCILLKYR